MTILAFSAVGIFAYAIGVVDALYTAKIINKSPDCKKKIKFNVWSIRTQVIAILNLLLWLIVVGTKGISIISISYMVIATCLLTLSVVDFAIYEIPFHINVIIGLAAIPTFINDFDIWYVHIIGAVCVSGLFWLFAVIKYRGQEMMGGGDVKLMIVAGFLLGWVKIILAMVIGCIIGSVIHCLRMVIDRKNEHVLAFGPYLSIAIFIMMIIGNNIVNWYVSTFFGGI